MKVVALLSWYDEPAAWLAACVTSLRRLPVQHVIAVDGAYLLFPDAGAWSPPEQHQALIETCRAMDYGLTLHTPSHPWAGNEIEKRTHMFRLADTVCEPGDWLLVIDADELVRSAFGFDLEALDDVDVATSMLLQRIDPLGTRQSARAAGNFDWDHTSRSTIRNLFRWTPGITVEGRHYRYQTADGRLLWGDEHDQLEHAADSHITIEHRQRERDINRTSRQQTYYQRRDQLRVEAT